MPERFNDASGAFVGSLAIAFALVGLLAGPRQRWGFGLLALFTLAVSVSLPGLSDVIGSLPLFSISLGGRLVFVTAFAFAVLAAFGFDAARRDPTRARMALLMAVGLILTLGGWWRLETMLEMGRDAVSHRQSIPWLTAPILAALAGLLWRSPRHLAWIWIGLFLFTHRAELPRFYHSLERIPVE